METTRLSVTQFATQASLSALPVTEVMPGGPRSCVECITLPLDSGGRGFNNPRDGACRIENNSEIRNEIFEPRAADTIICRSI